MKAGYVLKAEGTYEKLSKLSQNEISTLLGKPLDRTKISLDEVTQILIFNTEGKGPLNLLASSYSGQKIYGDAILCTTNFIEEQTK